MRFLPILLLTAVSLLLPPVSSTAQVPGVPGLLGFQGRLSTDIGQPMDSTGVLIDFTLYKGGDPVWTETQSVNVGGGLFNVMLGLVTPLDTVDFDQPMDLGIKLDGEAEEMVPRTPLSAAAFARALPGLHTLYRDVGGLKSHNIIGGSWTNMIGSDVTGATISGGGAVEGASPHPNTVLDDFGAIGGGLDNVASGLGATIGGGASNVAEGDYSTVPGGRESVAAKSYSFASGWKAKANHGGSFVWADSTDADFASTDANQFLIRAGGGVGIGTNSPGYPLHVDGTSEYRILKLESSSTIGTYLDFANTSPNGREFSVGILANTGTGNSVFTITDKTATVHRLVVLHDGKVGVGTTTPDYPLEMLSGAHVTAGGIWTDGSSRERKYDFQEVDATDILDKVAELPVTRWRFMNEPDSQHLGPVAEDFHDAFGLGADNKHIAALDGNGIAFASIQRLYELVKEQQAEIERLRKMVEEGL